MAPNTIIVSAGQTSTGLVANGNTFVTVEAGGTVINTTVNSLGLVRVFGSADNTTVNLSGFVVVDSAGVDSGAVVSSGGQELLGFNFDEFGLGNIVSSSGHRR